MTNTRPVNLDARIPDELAAAAVDHTLKHARIAEAAEALAATMRSHRADMVCYISGPMTGHDDHNFPAFHAAEAALRAAYPDAEILNPANHFGGRTDLPRSVYMRADIADLLRATHVYMLRGWSHSRGAVVERDIAIELDLQIMYAPDAERAHVPQEHTTRTILDEAAHVVDGPRREAYGHPMNNHARTARLWSAYLGHPVTPRQVCWCMILTKCSRDANFAKRDNLVDTAGYARNIEMIEEYERCAQSSAASDTPSTSHRASRATPRGTVRHPTGPDGSSGSSGP